MQKLENQARISSVWKNQKNDVRNRKVNNRMYVTS
jgi:hypothetical protein